MLSRPFTSQPGADTMPGLVPDGAKCGTKTGKYLLACTGMRWL